LFAARQGEIDSLRTLLDAGADINQADPDGNNSLLLAILNTHYDLAQFLLDRGADPNAANKDGRTVLFMAVDMHDADYSPRPARKEKDKLTSEDIIHSLVAHKANVNAQLKTSSEIHRFAQDHGDKTLAGGATAFMRAAKSADLPTMHFLLDNGADPKLANKDGLTALLLAAGVGWNERVHGSEADALEAVKICFERGLAVTAATDKDETAMHGAALRGANSIVKFLAEKGANINVKNKQGFTPLDIANGKGGLMGAPRDPRPATMALIQELGGKSALSLTAGNLDQPKDEAK
jgi:uncharacterized protein